MQQKGDGKVLALSVVALAIIFVGGMIWWAVAHPTSGTVKGAETEVRIKGVTDEQKEINSQK